MSVEHKNIPEAHRGLHDFLYNSDSEHETAAATNSPELSNDGT